MTRMRSKLKRTLSKVISISLILWRPFKRSIKSYSMMKPCPNRRRAAMKVSTKSKIHFRRKCPVIITKLKIPQAKKTLLKIYWYRNCLTREMKWQKVWKNTRRIRWLTCKRRTSCCWATTKKRPLTLALHREMFWSRALEPKKSQQIHISRRLCQENRPMIIWNMLIRLTNLWRMIIRISKMKKFGELRLRKLKFVNHIYKIKSMEHIKTLWRTRTKDCQNTN